MMDRFGRPILMFVGVSIGPVFTHAVLNADQVETRAVADRQVAARVDGESILVAEVEHALASLAQRRPGTDIRDGQLFSASLQQIVRRRLAHRRLEKLGGAASKYEVEQVLAERRAGLEGQGQSLDAVIAEARIDLAVYRRDLAWALSWDKHCRKELTDGHLQEFFTTHRRAFDGTEVRARHILFSREPSRPGASPPRLSNEDRAKLVRDAEHVRRQILEKKLSFTDATKRFSSAPSRDSGGDLGYFPRSGVMHEAVAAAAFALRPGELSRPVASPFGVHLIEVTDQRPGTRQWTDVRNRLRKAAERELFDRLVAEQRQTSRVEIIWRPSKKE